jgi:succinate-semialdehyde dehydrogenase/glutarate-semialdehyde dehydrogenase
MSLDPLYIECLLDGDKGRSRQRARFNVYSPATGELVGSAPEADQEDLDRAVHVARTAFRNWSGQTAYQREASLRKAAQHVRAHADEIARAMSLEQGKPFDQSRSEVLGSCDTIDYYAAEAVRVEGVTNPTEKPNLRSWTIYQPVGVCGLITPWNYPVSLLSWKLGPALAAGCSLVVKPSPVAPISPLLFCRYLAEGGLVPGLISVLTGSGETLAVRLVEHPGVAKIAMTGSTATGQKIMAACSTGLKKVSLELGGQCPAIVCSDADLDLAAQVIAYKGFRNAGQSCSSINRVYVASEVHDVLVEKTRQLAEKLRLGDGLDTVADLGPMTTSEALDRTKQHIADAVEKGARLVTGGKAAVGPVFAKGRYFLPTILTGVDHSMLLMREETFGPVVPFARFHDVAEAVASANRSDYGLVAYVFTRDLGATIKISEELEAGTICVNNGAVNTNYGPYEGWKMSGFGLELSRRAIFEYLRTKHVKIQI